MSDTFIVMVTGGRDYALSSRDHRWLKSHLETLHEWHDLVFVHGDAHGLDSEAAEVASAMGIAVVPFYAPWTQVGKRAGHVRNWQMLRAANVLLAFPGGRGTENCVAQAGVLGVDTKESPTRVYRRG